MALGNRLLGNACHNSKLMKRKGREDAATGDSDELQEALNKLNGLLNGTVQWSSEIQNILELHPEVLLAQDASGDTPLHMALLKGHLYLADSLINLALDRQCEALHMRNSSGHSLLHYAIDYQCERGLRIQRLLVRSGANLTVGDALLGRNVVHYCAAEGLSESLRLLLSEGKVEENFLSEETLNAPDGAGLRPVHLAAAAQHWSCLLLLVSRRGVSIDVRTVGRGETALLRAVAACDTVSVHTLLKLGAGVNTAGYDGCAPLEVVFQELVVADDAARCELESIAVLLAQANADMSEFLSSRNKEMRNLVFKLHDIVTNIVLKNILYNIMNFVF